MSFFEFIEALRKKPEAVRHRIVIGAVLAVMILLIMGWARTIPATIQSRPADTASPFKVISEGIEDIGTLIQR